VRLADRFDAVAFGVNHFAVLDDGNAHAGDVMGFETFRHGGIETVERIRGQDAKRTEKTNGNGKGESIHGASPVAVAWVIPDPLAGVTPCGKIHDLLSRWDESDGSVSSFGI